MADKTSIEWTQATWNPTTGCDRVSAGCDHCYALTLAKRLKAMGAAKYQTDGDPRTSGPGFGLAVHEDALTIPLRWRRPRRVFVNSMSDLFHDRVPDEFVADTFAVMALAPRHTFQVLTKRHARMRSLLASKRFAALVRNRVYSRHPYGKPADLPLPNVWLGVSVEDQRWADIRIPALLGTPAAVRWISAEPLLGPVSLEVPPFWCYGHGCPTTECPNDLHLRRQGIDWVVVGGESGPDARPMHPDWARSLRDQCMGAGVPFLFKQWGGRTPKAGGRELDGRTWDQYPVSRP